jgi:DNA-binding transcriptional LysR family regulator
MDELKQLRTFVTVVKSGSLSSAAGDDVSISSVSRQVSALEEAFGAQLLNRNSRRLSLTEAGDHLYARAVSIINDLDVVKSEIKSLNEDVRGAIRVCLRVAPGMTRVLWGLPRLIERYPELHVDITLTDKRLDLIENKLDLALWSGDLPDSTDLIARKLRTTHRVLCCSPSYVEKRGLPEKPRDLLNHSCLVYRAPTYKSTWTFTKGNEIEEVAVKGPFVIDDGIMLLELGLCGQGIMIHPMWMVGPYLARNKLVQILPEYTVQHRVEHADLFVVYPRSRNRSRKVRAFVDFLVEEFK